MFEVIRKIIYYFSTVLDLSELPIALVKKS